MDMNIYELIRGRRQYLQEQRIKNYMYQLLKSMDHMHRNGIFHRDIKPENILITDDELKLADFGSCRGIYSKQPYTEYISTRWYRAPECLLTDGFYNYKMDMWGVGCVFFEVLSLYPLFPGTNELDQVTKIHQILGTPPAGDAWPSSRSTPTRTSTSTSRTRSRSRMSKLIPHCTPDCVDVIVKLLAYDPDDRLSARQAVKHTYFKDLRASEKKEQQAAQQAAADSGDVNEDRTHAPAGATTRSKKGAAYQQAAADSGGSSMLPSIGGHGAGGGGGVSMSSSKKHSHHSDNVGAPQAAAEAPQALQAQHHGHGDGDEGSSSTLPPIGFGAGNRGGGLPARRPRRRRPKDRFQVADGPQGAEGGDGPQAPRQARHRHPGQVVRDAPQAGDGRLGHHDAVALVRVVRRRQPRLQHRQLVLLDVAARWGGRRRKPCAARGRRQEEDLVVVSVAVLAALAQEIKSIVRRRYEWTL